MHFIKSLLLLVCFACATAETVMVYRDQYLIKSNFLGISLTDELNKVDGVIIKRLQNGISLIRPKTLSASSQDLNEVVEYDTSKNYCHYLLKSGIARMCSPNYQLKATITPNDPHAPQLWGLSDKAIQAEKAWDTTTGSSSVVVAVIDSGVDYNHVDLADNIWINPLEIANNGLDDDANGYIDDVHGINAITHTGNPMDDNYHGTHCAGTIAAIGNNGAGVVGVTWNAKIMALKFLDQQGVGDVFNAVKAINYMIAMKKKGVNIKVASNSWAGSGRSDILLDAIKRADAEGIIFVAAAGNDYGSDNDVTDTYPANSDSENVISVAATDSDNNLANFSNIGFRTVDIAAPGVGILSTTPGNGYHLASGTSMATPHVSGAVALLAGLHPELNVRDLVKRVYETAVQLPSLSGLIKTGRILNLYRMVTNQTIPLDVPTAKKNYNVYETSYTPDLSADSEPSIIKSDEESYKTVNLPFSFPYGIYSTKKVVISPNGVIYLQKAPGEWDYRNTSLAPVFSVAGFHTDLDSTLGGVKVKVSSNRITVYWKATHFRYKDLGFIEIRTTLYANGVIKSFVNTPISDSSLSSLGTIGVTHADSNNAQVIKATHNLFGVQFTPVAPIPEIAGIIVSSVKIGVVKTKKAGLRFSKEELRLSVLGKGRGKIKVQTKFDGLKCSNAKLFKFLNGSKATANLTATIKRFKNISVTVNTLTSTTRVGIGNSKAKKIYLRSACRQLLAGLK